MIDLTKLTVEEVSSLQARCKAHLEAWFGFSEAGKAARTDEFIAAVKWRLDGQTEPCCECGEPYPRADLWLDDHIYCPKCRKEE